MKLNLHDKPGSPNNVGCKHKQATLYPLLLGADIMRSRNHRLPGGIGADHELQPGPFHEGEHHRPTYTNHGTNNFGHPGEIPHGKCFNSDHHHHHHNQINSFISYILIITFIHSLMYVPEYNSYEKGESRNCVDASRSKGCGDVVHCIRVEIQTQTYPEIK